MEIQLLSDTAMIVKGSRFERFRVVFQLENLFSRPLRLILSPRNVALGYCANRTLAHLSGRQIEHFHPIPKDLLTLR